MESRNVMKGLGALTIVVTLATAFAAFPSRVFGQEDIDSITRSAFAELQNGNWQAASELFEKIAAMYGKEPLSLYGSAVASFNLGDLQTSENRVGEAIAMLEKSGGNSGLLADCLTLSAVISARRGANSDAVAKLRRAVSMMPGHFDANLSLARALYGSGDIAGSVAYFRKAAEIRPADPNARFLLASALENLGEFDLAVVEYRELVKADPKNVSGLVGLGALLIKTQGDGSVEGRRSLEEAVRLNGRDYESRVTLGKLLVRTKEYEDAVTHLLAAAELKPNIPEPHYQLAIAYRRLGKKAEAEEEMKKVKEIHEGRRGDQ